MLRRERGVVPQSVASRPIKKRLGRTIDTKVKLNYKKNAQKILLTDVSDICKKDNERAKSSRLRTAMALVANAASLATTA